MSNRLQKFMIATAFAATGAAFTMPQAAAQAVGGCGDNNCVVQGGGSTVTPPNNTSDSGSSSNDDDAPQSQRKINIELVDLQQCIFSRNADTGRFISLTTRQPAHCCAVAKDNGIGTGNQCGVANHFSSSSSSSNDNNDDGREQEICTSDCGDTSDVTQDSPATGDNVHAGGGNTPPSSGPNNAGPAANI